MKRVITLAVIALQAFATQAITLTPLVKPEVPDSLMHASVYDEVIVKEADLPIKMTGPDVDFVKEYDVAKKGENITLKLQSAIDKYSAEGGAKLHIKKGDYNIGEVSLNSNIHLLFEAGTILRPYSDNIYEISVFKVGPLKGSDGTAPTVENVSIQGVGGRVDVLLSPVCDGYLHKFNFIKSMLVKDFYYANFNIYDHRTLGPSLGFGSASFNEENYVGATNGVIMNFTCIDSHYGYGLIQTQAGRNLRFYNLHGIGGITLRMETGGAAMNKAQFGGVWDIEGENISVANGHGAVLCGPHGMKNGVVHIKNVTAVASGSAFGLGGSEDVSQDKKGGGHPGSFGAGSSINNVTAIFGFGAQVKTKELHLIPREYLDKLEQPATAGIISNAPSHTCVKIATSVPIIYDIDSFHAIGFEYGNQIRITDSKEVDQQIQREYMTYIKEKYASAPQPASKKGRKDLIREALGTEKR